MAATFWRQPGVGRADGRGPGQARPNKYGARRAPCAQGGTPHVHDSQAERRRCLALHLRQQRGELHHLAIHAPRYPLCVNGALVGTYTPDFSYYRMPEGTFVIEDVKSPATRRTEGYRLRARLFAACYPALTITEVT